MEIFFLAVEFGLIYSKFAPILTDPLFIWIWDVLFGFILSFNLSMFLVFVDYSSLNDGIDLFILKLYIWSLSCCCWMRNLAMFLFIWFASICSYQLITLTYSFALRLYILIKNIKIKFELGRIEVVCWASKPLLAS